MNAVYIGRKIIEGKVRIQVPDYEGDNYCAANYLNEEQALEIMTHLNAVFQLGADLTVMEQDS